MRPIWRAIRPHLVSWHMLPCVLMIAAAVVVAVVTGQPTRVLGAVGCMVMMVGMMAAMGSHGNASRGKRED